MSRPPSPLTLPEFDPRLVPVTGVDDHLPAVATEQLTPSALRQRFEKPPIWQPEIRVEPRFIDRSPAPAAVLVPLVQRPQGLSVLLTQRTEHLSTHSGQVAFPGGRVDDDDRDAIHAALRETHEEVGVESQYIDVLGELPVYTTGSQFVITPVVALVREGFVLRPNTAEVAQAFEVPLEFLMNPAHHRHHSFYWAGKTREWLSMPYAERPSQSEHFIWGATAGMLRNLYRFLRA